MAMTKGHVLPKKAIEIGFNENYNPLIFNQVGPMAVTKAFIRNQDAQRGVHVYEKDAFYPFNYQQSAYLLSNNEHSDALLDRLRDTSISLHLYGHKTRHISIDSSSIIVKAANRFKVTSKSNSRTISGYFLILPDLIGMNTPVQVLGDIRIVAVYDDHSNVEEAFLEVEIKSKNGKLFMAGSDQDSGSSIILINAKNPASLNQKLSKLIYMASPTQEKDSLILKLQVYSMGHINGPPQISVSEIPVYILGNLVTIIVKTVGRMDKVFELARSCKKLYPEVNIIVSDDAENITKLEGDRKMFYYLPLPADIGLSAGRNRMVKRVQTEYFLTLDDDFVCDSHSKIERLIHALEMPPKDGVRFDIAAAKNPVDEKKFSLDFCGIIAIRDQTLFLESGSYGKHLQCQHVDFVPNIFVGRTSLFKNELQWDERLKLGEHEDFFLRAKTMNVRVLTCPSVSFQHDQVEHWRGKTKYDKMRNRVYDFWKDSLRKHGLVRLVSFGMTMMDLVSNFILLFYF